MKENIINNKKRIIFWGILFILVLSFSITGIVSFYKGYGNIGSVRYKLIPIAKRFNEIDAVIRNGDLKASVSGTKIKVYDSKNKVKYIYQYKEENGIKYITNTYEIKNSKIGNLVSFGMIQASYLANGGTSDIDKYYELDSFTNTTLYDGAIIENKQGNKTISINIDTNIVLNIRDKVKTIQEKYAINEKDLENLQEELNTNKKFIKSNDRITIYIKNTSGISFYEVFVSCDDKEIINRSYANVIKVLKPEVYEELLDDKGNISFETYTNRYRILEKVTFNEKDIFKNIDNIGELMIYK